MEQAHNLEDAIHNLDSARPLTREESAFFVEREHSERHEMSHYLKVLAKKPTENYARFLFTGHRGAGKGTELNRLHQELLNDYCVVHFSVRDKLEVADLEYRDVVFSIGMGVVGLIEQDDALQKAVPRTMLKPIVDFFAEIYSEKDFKAQFDASLEVKPTLLNLLTGAARYGTERTTRETIRKNISGNLNTLRTAIDDLARLIERAKNKKILVIVEDLDKASLPKARELFFEHGQTLAFLPVHLIYTFPVALRHSNDFTQITAYFENYDLPNIKIHARDNQPVSLAVLEDIIKVRVSEKLFEVGVLEELAKKSGGLIRSLIELANSACLQAVVKNKPKVGVEHVQAAVAKIRAQYARILTPEQKTRLKEIHAEKIISNTELDRDLLANLSVLEYRNDDPNPWYDVHPIVQDLL
jgi:hypothetical protein